MQAVVEPVSGREPSDGSLRVQNGRMLVLEALREEMSLEGIVRAELSAWNKLLPVQWGDRALVGREQLVAEWLSAVMRSEISFEPEETLLARKLGRGARPLALNGLKERLIYRAAVSLVEQRSGSPDRTQTAFDSFQRAPLQSSQTKYVLKADIASFYQYVDHERLVDEVIAQTGDDLAISLAVDVVSGASGRRYGLPQLSAASDVLAEIYIEPARRQLVRSGFDTWRFADDFRVACEDYVTALGALEALDDAARELGLVLNELKTSTPKRARYAASITMTEDRERELLDSLDIAEFDEPGFEWYDDIGGDGTLSMPASLLEHPDFEEGDLAVHGASGEEEGDHEVNPGRLAAASAVLERWVEEEEDDETQRGESAHVTAKLLGRALRVFSAAESVEAVENAAAMLVYEPSLTPTIARYLQVCSAVDQEQTQLALDTICGSNIIGAWQSVWIAHVAGSLPRRRGGGQQAHVLWLRRQLQSPRGSLRAEAALALARRGLITRKRLLALVPGLAPKHHPTLTLALVALGDDDVAEDLAESELDRARIDWAAEHLAQ